MNDTLTFPTETTPALSVADVGFLTRLLRPAYLGRPVEDWSFKRACAYWRLDLRRHCGPRVDAHLALFARRLERCRTLLAAGCVTLATGVQAGPLTVGSLLSLHAQLLLRYDRHLNLIRRRVGEGR